MGKVFILTFAMLLSLSASRAVAHGVCEHNLEKQANVRGQWAGVTVVLDTNVILNDPGAIYKYPGANLIIPGTVLEELNTKKTDPRLGQAARIFHRDIWNLINKNKTTVRIPVGEGSTVSVDNGKYTDLLKDTTMDQTLKDNEIIATALKYLQAGDKDHVALISDDLNVRIKAASLDIPSYAFELDWGQTFAEKSSDSDIPIYEISDEEMAQFMATGHVAKPENLKIAPNEFVSFKSPTTPPSEKTVGRFKYNAEQPDNLQIRALPDFTRLGLLGLPLNLEQAMALDLLLDPTVNCVILEAKAGTGKTFLTMMAALYLKDRGFFNRILLSKPTVHMGRDPGAVPGDHDMKYAPWMETYLATLGKLLGAKKNQNGQNQQAQQSWKKKKKAKYQKYDGNQNAYANNYLNDGNQNGNPNNNGDGQRFLQSLPPGFKLLMLEFIRGESLDRSMMVLDESQNTNVHQMKTFLTRIGEGTKAVIMGDPSQIDVSPNFVNATNNGLTVFGQILTNPDMSLAKRALTGRVKLHIGVRSAFSELVSDEYEKYGRRE